MCLITCLKPLENMCNGEVKREWLERGWENNKDGAGFTYVKNVGVSNARIGVIIKKGFFEFEKFLNEFNKFRNENPKSFFMIHFRNATAGVITPENCHPFRINTNVVMCHNGTIQKLVVKDDKKSDSLELSKLLKTFKNRMFQYDPVLSKLIHNFIGVTNKLSFLDTSNNIRMFNFDRWIKEDDGNIYFSNDYYKSKRVYYNVSCNEHEVYNSNVKPEEKKLVPFKAVYHKGICCSCKQYKYVTFRWEVNADICAACICENETYKEENNTNKTQEQPPTTKPSTENHVDDNTNITNNSIGFGICKQCNTLIKTKSEKDNGLCTNCLVEKYGESCVYDYD